MPWFEASHLRKEFLLDPKSGKTTVALDDFSLSAERGDFISIVGRSGSGKTTFLRLISGLLTCSSGEIRFCGADGTKIFPKIGTVFQEPRLMPWLTVRENILFAYLAGNKKDEKNKKNIPYDRADALLEMLGLSAYKNAYPNQLSGGMAQRVALGRALCYEPELILMDEPFGALDYFTRRALQEELLKIHRDEKKTIFFVTHDIEEALTTSRRIVVLSGGRMLKEIEVAMPYPRRQSDPAFAFLLEEILSLLL